MKWRQQWDVENIKNWEPPEAIKLYYPSGGTGFDKDGAPGNQNKTSYHVFFMTTFSYSNCCTICWFGYHWHASFNHPARFYKENYSGIRTLSRAGKAKSKSPACGNL